MSSPSKLSCLGKTTDLGNGDAVIRNPPAWIISGLFVLLATPMTVYQVRIPPQPATAGAHCFGGPSCGVPRCCSVLTCAAAGAWAGSQVAMHYENYTKPEYQRRILRILWMVRRRPFRGTFALPMLRLEWTLLKAPSRHPLAPAALSSLFVPAMPPRCLSTDSAAGSRSVSDTP